MKIIMWIGYIYEEPGATIFKNAKIIIGRTK